MDVSGPNRSSRRLPARAGSLVVACLTSFLLLTAIGPAHAHTDLVGSSPAAEGIVPLTSDRLVLAFSEEVAPVGSRVIVRDPSGQEVSQGEPERDGSALVVRLHLSEPGRHEVAYRVVGADGHPVIGSYRFVAVPAASARTAAGPSTDDVSEVGSPGVSLEATASAEAGRATGSPLRWVLPGVAALVLVLMVLHTLSRRLTQAPRRT